MLRVVLLAFSVAACATQERAPAYVAQPEPTAEQVAARAASDRQLFAAQRDAICSASGISPTHARSAECRATHPDSRPISPSVFVPIMRAANVCRQSGVSYGAPGWSACVMAHAQSDASGRGQFCIPIGGAIYCE